MDLRIEHRTEFAYDEQIAEAYTELRLRPLSAGGQFCSAFTLVTDPPGVRVRAYRDRLGNHVQHLEVLEDHDRISITALSEVTTARGFLDPARELTPLERHDYLAGTHYAPLSGAVRAVAVEMDGDPGRAAMATVRRLLAYEPGTTDVTTSADQVLVLGRGVCQDFAHVMLALCRRDGLPARYVSGYLYDPALEGDNAASHAWVDVWDDERGWVSLDPTHDREQSEAYVRVAVGRDYADVPPTRGVYKGGARETLDVAVRLSQR